MTDEKKKGGCYQFVYCSECMAFPMGLGCEKEECESAWVVKGKLKKLKKE